MRERHGAEQRDASSRTNMLMVRARALAKANVATRFAARWALLFQAKDDPAFVAKVEALKAEEAHELERHTQDLVRIVRAERRASRALLKDKQQRERQALAARYASQAAYFIPVSRYAVLKSPLALIQRARLVYFRTAGRMTTLRHHDQYFRFGLPRLLFRRAGSPPS